MEVPKLIFRNTMNTPQKKHETSKQKSIFLKDQVLTSKVIKRENHLANILGQILVLKYGLGKEWIMAEVVKLRLLTSHTS